MVQYSGRNPATGARYAENAEYRRERLMQERERAGFRQRQSYEQAQAVDAAVRRGLGGVIAGPGGQPQQASQNPYQHQVGIARGPRPQQPGAAPQPQQPQAQPQGGTRGNLMRQLTSTPGGGALALQQHTQQQQREDEAADRAWDAYVKGDIQMASTLMVQASGRDLPPYWKTKEAMLRAKAAQVEAIALYPQNIEMRREFIKEYMVDPGAALNKFPGADVVPKAGAQQTWTLKRSAWLAVYPGDDRGALEYAAGRKQIPPAQMLEAAYKIATGMMPEPIFGSPGRATYAKDIKAKAEELYQELRAAGGGQQQAGAPGTQGVGAHPHPGDPGQPQAVGGQPGTLPPAAGSTGAPQPGAPQPTQPVSLPPDPFPPGGATQATPEPVGPSGALVTPGTAPPVPPPVNQQPSSGVIQPPGTEQTQPPLKVSVQPPNPLADNPLWMQQGGQPPVEPAYRPRRAPPVEPGSVDGSASELDAIGAQGAGTNEDPLIPQVQADIDNAPSGTVMLVPNPADPGGALQKMVKP